MTNNRRLVVRSLVVLALAALPSLAPRAHAQTPTTPAEPAKDAPPAPVSDPSMPPAPPAPSEPAPVAHVKEPAAAEPAMPPAGAPPARRPDWLPPPDWRLVLNDLFAFRWNQLGIENQTRFGVQKRLYVRDDSAVLRDNFVFLGIYPKINPAFAKFGPSIEIQPASVFNLRLAAEWMGFFKTFGFMQSFQSPVVDYSDTTLARNKDDLKNYATQGLHVMIEPTIQMRFPVGKNPDGSAKHGNLAIRNKFAAEYWHMNVHQPPDNPDRFDTVWYDATLDTLVPAQGWVIQNDLDVLFQTKFRLTVGVRWTVVHPFYSTDTFRTPEEAAAYKNENEHQRLGPLLAYTFWDDGYSRFNRPTLLFIANWYLSHRYRTGADAPIEIPYMVVGFSFQSDFIK